MAATDDDDVAGRGKGPIGGENGHGGNKGFGWRCEGRLGQPSKADPFRCTLFRGRVSIGETDRTNNAGGGKDAASMSLLETKPWTVAEFFAWQERQEDRYELVAGFPAKMMTGASNRHDIITGNLHGELQTRLKGKPCRLITGDGAVETFPGQIRRPDAGIDCGRVELDGYLSAETIVVFEVLSPSTRDFDRLRKVEEYKAVPTMRHVVVVEPMRPQVLIWSRPEGADWAALEVSGLEGVVELAAVGITLPMTDIYDRLEFGD
ncbi:Uma2 family endonuclease [Jiella sp. M17.18]|uniref:Uma2 family endonuclease n=1 Tax=Jiella sp. M17.18 TaxID=3234247 RepID=UPI0034DF208B